MKTNFHCSFPLGVQSLTSILSSVSSLCAYHCHVDWFRVIEVVVDDPSVSHCAILDLEL